MPSIDIPDHALKDPTWVRSGFTERGRDNCRLPLPWEGSEPPFGFSTTAQTWLPVPPQYAALTVEVQLDDADSTLNLVRAGLELRAQRPEFAGDEIEWYGAPKDCFAFRRSTGGLICVLNSGQTPVMLPPGDLLLSSAPLQTDGLLPGNAAAWLVPPPQ